MPLPRDSSAMSQIRHTRRKVLVGTVAGTLTLVAGCSGPGEDDGDGVPGY